MGLTYLLFTGAGRLRPGEIVVRSVLENEFSWIAPSRFGYLRSTFNDGATFEDQAKAYAFLLDHLGVKKVAVSHCPMGGLRLCCSQPCIPNASPPLPWSPAGWRHPARTVRPGGQKRRPVGGHVQTGSFLLGLTRFFRKQFIGLMGANLEVFNALSPEQRDLVDQVIDYMNPSSLRSAGANFDNKAKLPGERIVAIKCPTLVLHARDDMLQLFHNAEYAQRHIASARLVSFDRGGHLLMIVEQEILQKEIKMHILEHFDKVRQ